MTIWQELCGPDRGNIQGSWSSLLGDEASRVRRVSDFPLGRFSPSALFNQSSQSLLLATPVATLLGSYCLFPLGVDCICVASDFHTGCYLGTQHSARWAPSASPADEVTSVENISGQTGPESGCQLVVFVVQVVTSSGNAGGTMQCVAMIAEHAAVTAAAAC